mmetsp:Transcript_25951/g.40884  ORF Transcript_25951/g.40884 Transcript_25951/m.40884 type:complete len:90 (+) Transcript_25951:169-438(+)
MLFCTSTHLPMTVRIFRSWIYSVTHGRLAFGCDDDAQISSEHEEGEQNVSMKAKKGNGCWEFFLLLVVLSSLVHNPTSSHYPSSLGLSY